MNSATRAPSGRGSASSRLEPHAENAPAAGIGCFGRQQAEVGAQDAVPVEPREWPAHDADGRVGGDRRDARARALEDERARPEPGGEPGPGRDVRLVRLAGEPAADAAAADGPHAGEDGPLEMVGGGVAAVGRDGEEIVEAGPWHRDGRLGRPAAPHANDHGVPAAAGEQARPVPRHRGLAGPLPGRDDRELRAREVDHGVLGRRER